MVQAAFGGKVQRQDLQLYFSPVDAIIGQHYVDDPAVEESSLKLSQYSCLRWLKKYPHWYLSVRFLPPAPLPPGVAAHRAAALSEGKDPDIAVRDARSRVRPSAQKSSRPCWTENKNAFSKHELLHLSLHVQLPGIVD